MHIPTDKIREVIGSGGKVIREIVEKTGAKINIEDDGTVKIASSDGKEIEAAQQVDPLHRRRAGSRRDLPGHGRQDRRLRRLRQLLRPKDGLVHISQLADERVAKTTDVVKEGDKVWVKLLGFDERGKVRLSMKVVDQATGKEIARDKKADGEEDAA